MHEHSLLRDIFNKLASISKENNNAPIKRVTIQLGALSHISADHLCEHFNKLARGSKAEFAELNIIESENIDDPHAQDIILESVEI